MHNLDMAVQVLGQWLSSLLGLERELQDVNSAQMAMRAVLIYVVALLLVRIGNKRLLSRATAFDIVVAILLGSILSRSVNGSAPLVPTILAAAAVIALHWLLAVLAFRTSFVGPLVKGEPRLLIKDGEVQEEQMRQAKLSDLDLQQALRSHSLQEPGQVKRAYLERDGSISVMPFDKTPQVIEVASDHGIQTIRIKME